MVVVAERQIASSADEVVTRVFFNTGALDVFPLGEQRPDTPWWPEPSPRATTLHSALALERASTADPMPRLDELEIDDGFGI